MLHEIFLPYREKPGLGDSTYLKTHFGKGEQGEQRLFLEELVPYAGDAQESQQGELTTFDNVDLQKFIDALAEIYGVPQRWDPDKIAETLFRRMRQFLQGNEGMLLSNSTLKDDAQIALTSALDQLLYCFQNQEEGDRGKDSLTTAMASLLAALINDEVEPASSSLESSALVQEIICWLGESSTDNIKRIQQAKRLREIIKRQQSSFNDELGENENNKNNH
jgi:hypothetical protein